MRLEFQSTTYLLTCLTCTKYHQSILQDFSTSNLEMWFAILIHVLHDSNCQLGCYWLRAKRKKHGLLGWGITTRWKTQKTTYNWEGQWRTCSPHLVLLFYVALFISWATFSTACFTAKAEQIPPPWINYPNYIKTKYVTIVNGSLEVKLTTLWWNEKHRRAD